MEKPEPDQFGYVMAYHKKFMGYYYKLYGFLSRWKLLKVLLTAKFYFELIIYNR